MNYQEALSKAMKLLNKGNDKGATPEESAIFLAKAQQIIDEYRLNVDDLNFDAEQLREDNEPINNYSDDPLDIAKYGKYREVWMRRLANIVAVQNQARLVYSTLYDRSVRLQIIGRPSDVTTVRYLYSFFKRQVEELIATECAGNSGPYLGQFSMGVLDTLWRKLHAARKETCETGRVKGQIAGEKIRTTAAKGALAAGQQPVKGARKFKFE